jgi:TctA family transporter
VVTALFIVALLAWGFLPGPEMVKKNADLIYSIIWIQGLSGIIGTLIGFLLAKELARLAELRYTFMVPILFIFILMGAFSVHRDPVDLLVAISFGVLGYFMRRFGYPRPAMILGLVLGDLMEKYLYRSMMAYGFSWLTRPAVIVLLILATLSFVLMLRGRLKGKTEAESLLGGVVVRADHDR